MVEIDPQILKERVNFQKKSEFDKTVGKALFFILLL